MSKSPIVLLFSLDKKFLLYNLIARNLKIKYRESFLGYLWTLLIPLSQTVIFYFLYKIVLKVDIPNYLLFLVSGLLPWFFFSLTLSESMESIGGNGALLNQMPIPIQVFPNMSAATNMVNLLASMPILIYIFATSNLPLSWDIFAVIPLFAGLYLQALSLGIILSIMYVYFRDLRHITSLVLQIWFYLTPVVYRKDMVPVSLAKYILYCNPISGFFVLFRDLLFDHIEIGIHLYIFLFWTLFLPVLAILILKKFGRGVVERI